MPTFRPLVGGKSASTVVTFGDNLSIVASVSIEMSEISLRLAGSVGACGLGLAAGSPGVLAAVDQHAAEVRDALTGRKAGRGPATRVLLGYARGFVEAAMGRGWVPTPAQTAAMDWESLRLAAVCLLLTQSPAVPLT